MMGVKIPPGPGASATKVVPAQEHSSTLEFGAGLTEVDVNEESVRPLNPRFDSPSIKANIAAGKYEEKLRLKAHKAVSYKYKQTAIVDPPDDALAGIQAEGKQVVKWFSAERDKFQYQYENWLETGSLLFKLFILMIMVLMLIAVTAFLYYFVDQDQYPYLRSHSKFLEQMWKAWGFLADPGTHSGVDENDLAVLEDLRSCREDVTRNETKCLAEANEKYHLENRYSCFSRANDYAHSDMKEPMGYDQFTDFLENLIFWKRFMSAFIALFGIFFFATILGFVVDSVQEFMKKLKTGKSQVVENSHYLVLGWTDRCPALIREIAEAGESAGGTTIVILAEQQKVELQAELDAVLSRNDLKKSRVVFRNGSSMVMSDLKIVSAHTAKVIIVLALPGDADKADSTVLRTVLQLKGLPQKLRGHVTCEMRDVDNEQLVQMVGDGDVETVVSHDIIGRLMLMAARQPGLANVYDAILGFKGDEFYLSEWPELEGLAFSELCLRFPDAVPLGIKSGDKVYLNPEHSRVFKAKDELLCIAADDDSYRPTSAFKVPHEQLTPPPRRRSHNRGPEKIMLCGWRRDVDDIIMQLDRMVEPGSELHILADAEMGHREEMLSAGGLNVETLANIKIVHHIGNPAVRKQLENLTMLDDMSSVLILADERREHDMMHSDSHTLATLLLLRNIREKHAEQKREALMAIAKSPTYRGARDDVDDGDFLVVCEILDHRTRNTIQNSPTLRTSADFVQSNEFVSRVLAMVAERREVKCVLDELLGSDGASLYVNPIHYYATPGEQLSFFALQKRAWHYRQILCGYKKFGLDPNINPEEKHRVQAWDNYELVVLSHTAGIGTPVTEVGKPTPIKAKLPGKESEVGLISDRLGGVNSTTTPPRSPSEMSNEIDPTNAVENRSQEVVLSHIQSQLSVLSPESRQQICERLMQATLLAQESQQEQWNFSMRMHKALFTPAAQNQPDSPVKEF